MLRPREQIIFFRLRAKAFHLYTAEKEVFDLPAFLEKNYEAGKTIDLSFFYKSGKEYYPVRICAVGKTKADIEKSYQHTEKTNARKQRGKVSDLQRIYSKYVLVATSLPQDISSRQILELYRMRWQIELVFKCLKSIFGGEFCAKKKEAVEAWFYGKLLPATVCEILVKRCRFSPCNEKNSDLQV